MKEGNIALALCKFFLEPFWSCFDVHLSSRTTESKCSRIVSHFEPEAAMVDAAKHFSSAHKVRFG